MTKRKWIVLGVLVGAPLIALGWWLGSPLFLDNEVNEEFPMSERAVVPDDMTQEQVEDEMADAANQDDVSVSQPMPEQSPTVVLSGQFTDFDSFHRGTGTATIYQLDDGSHVLRLEAFDVTNGPDLHVLLVPHADPASRADVGGYVDLGQLKGNVGDQNYEIPTDVNVGDYASVVIYCEPFHVIFSVASLG